MNGNQGQEQWAMRSLENEMFPFDAHQVDNASRTSYERQVTGRYRLVGLVSGQSEPAEKEYSNRVGRRYPAKVEITSTIFRSALRKDSSGLARDREHLVAQTGFCLLCRASLGR